MQLNRVLNYIIVAGLFLLLLTPLIVSRDLFFPFITGKAFFFRLIIEVLLGLWLFLVWREPAYRPRKSWLTMAILALVLVSTLATIFSQNPYRSFWSNLERMDGLVNYLHLLAYFLMISAMFRAERIWHWFFHVSIGVSLIMVGYSFAQLSEVIPISQGRLDGTLGNAIYLAAYMLFHVFLTAFLLFRHWNRAWTRYLYLPVIALQVYVLYRTATRGTILGLLAGAFIFAVILLIKRWSDQKIRRASLAGLIALVVIVGGVFFARNSSFVQNSPVLARFASISATEQTTESRLTIWQMSLRGFTERPVLGWGPENYNLVFNKYYEPKLWRQEQWFDRSHNIFLDWLIDAGALGLLAYLSIFATALYYLWRGRQNKFDIVTKALFTGLLVAYLVHNIFAFDNLTSYLLFFAFLAYLHFHTLPVQSESKVFKPLTEGDRILQRITIAALVAAVPVGGYYLSIKPLTVSAKLITALGQVPNGSNPDTVAKAKLDLFKQITDAKTFGSREAIEQLVGQAGGITQSAQVSNEVKQLVANTSVSLMQEEIAKSPQDARLHLILGATLSNFGQKELAIASLLKALELSPQKQTIMFQLAGAYVGQKDFQKALEIAERAFRLDENFLEARKFYALVLIYSGDLKSAEGLLSQTQSLELDDRFINAYVEAKRYDLVLKLWQNKVKQAPANAQNRFSLAAAYLQSGQRNLAIQELESASAIDAKLKATTDRLISEIRAGRNPITQ